MYVYNCMMERYIMIKSDGRVLIFTLTDCPEKEVKCSVCNTEEELYCLIREHNGDITFVRPYQWNVHGKTDKMVSVKFIFIKDGDYFHRVEFCRICWIKAEGSYCRLCVRDQKEYLVSFNLTELMAYLPSQDFVRVHRSYIVNINCVDSFFGNTLVVGSTWIPVSKPHRQEVMRQLNLLGNSR